MPLFQNLRESLGGFFSPGSSKQKTKRSPSLEEVKMRLDRNTVSPTKRTSDWLKAHSGEIKTPKALGVKGSRVTKSTPSKKQSAKAQAKLWDRVLPNFLSKQAAGKGQGGLEGETLVEEEHFSGVNDDDNETTLLNPDGSAIAELANPAPNAAADEDTPYEVTAKDLEAMKNWSKDEISLFHKLNMRGFEPLVPGDWSSEFVTLPGNLFSDNDAEVLIKAREGNEYNACRALQSLFNLGARVRDRIACKLPPSEAIRRDLLAYYKWSIMDAGLYHVDHIPVVAIATAAPRESVASVVGRVTDFLHDLGKQYRVHFFDHIDPVSKKTVFKRQLPTLYGIVITQMIVTFVTYDSRSPARQVQTMGIQDFSKLEQDVWHALSVAIVMCKARDYLIQLKEEHQVGGELEDGESDVDA
ncbi:MAG: hypothetical protein Q9207_004614 [Kuettlingeria erythrocarpa]